MTDQTAQKLIADEQPGLATDSVVKPDRAVENPLFVLFGARAVDRLLP